MHVVCSLHIWTRNGVGEWAAHRKEREKGKGGGQMLENEWKTKEREVLREASMNENPLYTHLIVWFVVNTRDIPMYFWNILYWMNDGNGNGTYKSHIKTTKFRSFHFTHWHECSEANHTKFNSFVVFNHNGAIFREFSIEGECVYTIEMKSTIAGAIQTHRTSMQHKQSEKCRSVTLTRSKQAKNWNWSDTRRKIKRKSSIQRLESATKQQRQSVFNVSL